MPATADPLQHSSAQTPSPVESGELPDSHQVWNRRKAAADTVYRLYAQAWETRLRRHARPVADCSKTLILSSVVAADGKPQVKAESWKCRERHCPICQSARAYKLHQAFRDALPALSAAVPGGVFLLLTLTVRNCPIQELRATLSAMNQAWRRLVVRKEFRIVRGWIRSTEVSRSAIGEAHPHFHVLLLVPPSYFGKSYIKQARWVALWQEAARLDYAPSVDIRRVKTAESGLSEAVKVATYSVQPAELTNDPAWFHELHRQVVGLRFLATGGVIKQLLGAGSDDDLLEVPEAPWPAPESRAFTWRRTAGRYRARDVDD